MTDSRAKKIISKFIYPKEQLTGSELAFRIFAKLDGIPIRKKRLPYLEALRIHTKAAIKRYGADYVDTVFDPLSIL